MALRLAASVAAAALVGSSASVTVPLGSLGSVPGGPAHADAKVTQFLAVPYAEAPIGSLRWNTPTPVQPWGSKAVGSATTFGADCAQVSGGKLTGQEDCLYVNIFTPATCITSKGSCNLPVLFYIFGGGYTTGDPNMYKGDSMVTASGYEAVVVTVNYRLNIFGFLYGSEIAASNQGNANFGLLDIFEALRFVQQYIGNFGGDNSNVMIFGQSAGGNAVLASLVATPPNPIANLFNRVAIHSGASNLIVNQAYAENSYNQVLATTKCADLKCLEGLDTTTLINAVNTLSSIEFYPVIDGTVLKDVPISLLASGQFNHNVDIIIGSVQDEYAHFWPPVATGSGANQITTLDDATGTKPGTKGNLIGSISGADWAQCKSIYTSSSYPYPKDLKGYTPQWWQMMRMLTDDNQGICSARLAARRLVKGGAKSVYVYQFADSSQSTGFTGHGTDCNYLFPGMTPLSGQPAAVSTAMVKTWVQFAKTGSPNGATGGFQGMWLTYDDKSDSLLYIDTTATPPTSFAPNNRKQACDFWDKQPWYGFQPSFANPNLVQPTSNIDLDTNYYYTTTLPPSLPTTPAPLPTTASPPGATPAPAASPAASPAPANAAAIQVTDKEQGSASSLTSSSPIFWVGVVSAVGIAAAAVGYCGYQCCQHNSHDYSVEEEESDIE